MRKYGKWGGRQKPRKYKKIWGIFIFVCIYLCVSQGPFIGGCRREGQGEGQGGTGAAEGGGAAARGSGAEKRG
eukprot:7434888-Pyramimonas_sp.AAC.1